MTSEKIICFSQKNVNNFSVEDMLEIQQLLKGVPDEAFPVLMNYKPSRSKVETGLVKVLMVLLIVVLMFSFGMAAALPITNIPFVREEAPWLRIVGAVVALALVPAIWFGCKMFKNIKPFNEQAYYECRELIIKYSKH